MNRVLLPFLDEQLLAAGAAQVVSTDSVPHPSNAISIALLLAQASAELFDNEQTRQAR